MRIKSTNKKLGGGPWWREFKEKEREEKEEIRREA